MRTCLNKMRTCLKIMRICLKKMRTVKMTRLQLALDLYLKGLYRTVTSIDSTRPKIFFIIIILSLSLMNKFYRNSHFRVASTL